MWHKGVRCWLWCYLHIGTATRGDVYCQRDLISDMQHTQRRPPGHDQPLRTHTYATTHSADPCVRLIKTDRLTPLKHLSQASQGRGGEALRQIKTLNRKYRRSGGVEEMDGRRRGWWRGVKGSGGGGRSRWRGSVTPVDQLK